MKRNIRITSWLITALLAGALCGASVLRAFEPQARLRIEGADSTLFSGPAVTEDCTITDTEGGEHEFSATAICALSAAAAKEGFDVEFVNYDFGLFLKKIGHNETPEDFSQSWSFWVNGEPAATGVDAYEFEPDDDMLLAFTKSPGVPLRIKLPTEVFIDESAVFTVEKHTGSYDQNFAWEGKWEKAAGAKLYWDKETYPVSESGRVEITPGKVGLHHIKADGKGFIRSPSYSLQIDEKQPTLSPTPSIPTTIPVVTITPSPISPTPIPTISPTPALSTLPPSPSPTPSPSVTVTGISDSRANTAAQQALSYLRSKQQKDGSIGGDMTTAWSALAFGANMQPAATVKSNQHSLLNRMTDISLQNTTDLERHILAVRAAGADPNFFYGKKLVQQLTTKLAEENNNLINNNIFAVLALLAADQKPNIPAIDEAVSKILKTQASNGSWQGPDLTAAAVQALVAYREAGGNRPVTTALNGARSYFRNTQDRHGGWGENSAATAWVIQAISALGDEDSDWATASGKTPRQALLRYQHSSGGFGWKSPDKPSVFMTAYAIPALLSQPWPVTLLDIDMNLPPTNKPPASLAKQSVFTPTPVPTRPSQHSPLPAGSVAGTFVPTNPTVKHSSAKDATYTAKSPLPKNNLANPSPEPPRPTPKINNFRSPGKDNRDFTLALFSLANMGIGLAVARLVWFI